MTARSILIYEVDLNEIVKLPELVYVLQYDTQFGYYALKQTGIDKFPTNKRFKFFLLDPPPLPKISSDYIIDNAKV